MKAVNYRQQDGCHNCAHVFVFREYDDHDRFYCCCDAPPRPKCGSILCREEFTSCFKDEAAYDAEYDAWEAWEKGRQVHQHGICDGFTPPTREAPHE